MKLDPHSIIFESTLFSSHRDLISIPETKQAQSGPSIKVPFVSSFSILLLNDILRWILLCWGMGWGTARAVLCIVECGATSLVSTQMTITPHSSSSDNQNCLQTLLNGGSSPHENHWFSPSYKAGLMLTNHFSRMASLNPHHIRR